MTREEAIAYITEWMKDGFALNKNDREALKMAIRSLNSLEEVYAKGYNDGFMQAEVNFENDKALSQEPCDDAISREMALKECHDIVVDGERYRVIQEETLLGLPPVTQKGDEKNV